MKDRMASLEIFASERFLKNYRRASPPLRRLTEGAIRDFTKRFHSNPKTVANNYDKLAHCKARILEIDVAGGARLLVDFSLNRLLLLDLGDHDVVSKYNDGKYLKDCGSKDTHVEFWNQHCSELFQNKPDGTYEPQYDQELRKEWIYFLDKEQDAILGKLLKRIEQFDSTSTFILGGPGTGKTCILLSLLALCSGTDYDCGIIISDNLTTYVEQSTGMEISRFRTDVASLDGSSFDILLLDDPTNDNLDRVLRLSKEGKIKHVIAAFDPLQLNHSITDQHLEVWRRRHKVNFYRLRDCYRQKENVGDAAKLIFDTIAKSSPFLAKEKKAAYRQSREAITNLSNELNFLNPGGYTKVYRAEDTVEDIRREVTRIRARKDLMWKHSPGLLVLVDNIELSSHAMAVISPLNEIGFVTEMNLADVDDIKGLEYQHSFVFIDSKKYHDLVQGFEGTGRASYESRRLLRIPFSRAKDSLVVFQIDSES